MVHTLENRAPENAGPARGMGLSGAMIGVAVVALLLPLVRSIVWAFLTTTQSKAAAVLEGIDATLPYLAAATLVLVAARLRPPRPPLGRLLHQPGLLACGVASVILVGAVFGSFTLGLVWRVLLGRSAAWSASALFQSLTDWGYLIGLAVMVSWIVLGAVHGWRAEPNAYDRVGRVIGWAWVLLAPLAVALRFMVLLGYLV